LARRAPATFALQERANWFLKRRRGEGRIGQKPGQFSGIRLRGRGGLGLAISPARGEAPADGRARAGTARRANALYGQQSGRQLSFGSFPDRQPGGFTGRSRWLPRAIELAGAVTAADPRAGASHASVKSSPPAEFYVLEGGLRRPRLGLTDTKGRGLEPLPAIVEFTGRLPHTPDCRNSPKVRGDDPPPSFATPAIRGQAARTRIQRSSPALVGPGARAPDEGARPVEGRRIEGALRGPTRGKVAHLGARRRGFTGHLGTCGGCRKPSCSCRGGPANHRAALPECVHVASKDGRPTF